MTDITLLTSAIHNLNRSINYKLFNKPFDGKDKSKTRTWIAELEKQAELLQLSDAEKINALYQNAEGGLSSYIKRWSETQGDARSYAELKRNILANFSNIPDPTAAMNQLRNIRQGIDEPVTLFAERLFILAHDCFPGISSDDTGGQRFAQSQLIHYFIQGLSNNQIKFKVMASQPDSLPKAVQIARDHINLVNSFNAFQTSHREPRYESDMEVTPTFHVRRSRQPILAVDRTTQPPPRPPLTCWTCGRVGHIASDCRHTRTIRRPRDRNFTARNYYNNNRFPNNNYNMHPTNNYQPNRMQNNTYNNRQTQNSQRRFTQQNNRPPTYRQKQQQTNTKN